MYNVPGESNISVKLYTNLKRRDSLSIPRSLEYKFCRFSNFAGFDFNITVCKIGEITFTYGKYGYI